jgi:hypothetical protein
LFSSKQLVLGHQLTGALDQRQQHVDCPMAELHGVAVVQQPALIGLQLKAAKTVNGHHGGWVERG